MTTAPASPRILSRLILLAAAALFALGAWWAVSAWRDWQRGYDPETVVAASLQGIQEQNVLVPFTARYVAVVTATQRRLCPSPQTTPIMPGPERYEVDLAELTHTDLTWDAAHPPHPRTPPPLQ